jgi:hypothetical protein
MCSFVVIGTDHRMQHSEPGLEGILRVWTSRQFFEPLAAIAEEYHEDIGDSIGQRLAAEHGLRWYNVDMTTDEKLKAGIREEQVSRPKSTEAVAYRVPSDEVRENAWIEKLLGSGSETAIVICGYVHFEPLVRKLKEKGHAVDRRVYLESVPEIRILAKTA